MKPILLIALWIWTGYTIPGDQIPAFELNNLDGKRVAFDDLKGDKLTVIDFWATWCGPCIQSMPELVGLSEEFADRGVNFVGINIDSPRNLAKVKPFARSIGITYPILLDVNSEVMSRLRVTGVPTLLVVNADREILLLHEGYRPGDARFLGEELDRLLEEQPAVK